MWIVPRAKVPRAPHECSLTCLPIWLRQLKYANATYLGFNDEIMDGEMPELAYAIVCVCALYYAGTFGWATTDLRVAYYAAFFAVVMSTLFLEILYVIELGKNDWVVQTTMLYAVVGPIVDLIWSTSWPGSGSLCFWFSQLVFALRVAESHYVEPIAWSVFGLGTSLFIVSFVFQKEFIHGYLRPRKAKLGSNDL